MLWHLSSFQVQALVDVAVVHELSPYVNVVSSPTLKISMSTPRVIVLEILHCEHCCWAFNVPEVQI